MPYAGDTALKAFRIRDVSRVPAKRGGGEESSATETTPSAQYHFCPV
jgi:hypothetical protein